MKVKLKDICEIQAGGTPARSNKNYWENGTIPWVKISDITGKFLNKTSEYITEAGLNNSSAKLFSKNTILYTIFATLGEVTILNIDATTNQAIAGIKITDKNIDLDYMYYFLTSKKEYISLTGRGVAQNNINLKILRNLELDLPTLKKQKEVANILDKITNLINLHNRQSEMLEQFIRSRFTELFGSQVTNPYNLERGIIGDVVKEVKYGTSSPADENGIYPYLRMGNITYDGYLDLTDLKYITVKDEEIHKYIVKKGDVLFNRTNSKELVGKTCVFNLDEPMIIAGYIIRIRTNNRVIPEYLSALLNSKYGKRTLYEMCKSIIGQANINAQELQKIKLLIPPIELQNQFAKEAQAIDKSKLAIQQSLEKLETLKKSLMQQYFG